MLAILVKGRMTTGTPSSLIIPHEWCTTRSRCCFLIMQIQKLGLK